MSFGLGIFLFALGAILAFALQDGLVSWVDINMMGYILMGAGVIVIIIGFALLAKKRSSLTTVRENVDPASGERITQNEHIVG